MALKGSVQKENDEDVFVAKFTNGTFEQLKELSDFLNEEGLIETNDPIDAVRMAIAFLQSAKENRENKK